MTGRLQFLQGAWRVKLRLGDGTQPWIPLNVDPAAKDVAEDRRKRLQRLATLLKKVGKIAESREILTHAAGERSERAFRNVEAVIEGFAPDAPVDNVAPTFRDVAEAFWTGKLQDEYPDAFPKRKGVRNLEETRSRLITFLPELGMRAVADITLDDIDRAKKLIPPMHVNTRRMYLKDLARVFALAVKPLRIVDRALDIDIPPAAPRPLFTFVYPEEEWLLATCQAIPFEYRFLYSWLARNGTRIGETIQLTWDHVNLERGEVHFDAAWTKTRTSRYWRLDEDVLEALKIRHAILKPEPSALVFTTPRGKMVDKRLLKRRFHQDLKEAGVTRRSIFKPEPGSYPLRIHDWRASFATLARAMGRPDSWIMDRTGHVKTDNLQKYDRGRRHSHELELGWYAPMSRALGMRAAKSIGPVWAQGHVYSMTEEVVREWSGTPKARGKSFGVTVEPERFGAPETEKTPENTHTDPEAGGASDPRGPAEISKVVRDVDQSDPGATAAPDTAEVIALRIEESLARDVSRALEHGWLEIANKLLAELTERRRARVAPAVPSLSDARAKRNGDKS